jgi:hypothetical protein
MTGNKIALLKKKHRKDKDRVEWALLSRSKPHKVLKWFGTKKPSKDRVLEEERRIQWFKHKSGEIIGKIHKVSSILYSEGVVHIADALVCCIESMINHESQDKNAIRLGKIVNLLQKKNEQELAEMLDTLIPDILSFENAKIVTDIKLKSKPIKRISALRAYNIAMLLRKKYLQGEIHETDFEYSKMKELESLLKAGFVLSKPTSHNELPKDANSWWEYFSKRGNK